MRKAIFAVAVAALTCGAAQAFDPFASDWASSAKSRARLIADGAGGAAVEIELAPGAITYWRNPGDSGLPPSFDFAGSANLATARPMFPAPKRIAEPDGSVAFGYADRVVLPILLSPSDNRQPVRLAVDLHYAVCEKVCLPAHAMLALQLVTGLTTPYAAEIATASAQVPVETPAETVGATAEPEGRGWRLCFYAKADGGARDLFLEPPEGVWLTAKREDAGPGRECFGVTADAPSKAPISVTATVVGTDKAFETGLTLPGP
jgi:DsbC/DsbD-like thiol-disulfide interchange protein